MNLFREAREKKGMTQKDLSKFLGYTSSQFVSNWERGRSTPPIESLNQVSEILELDVLLVKDYVFNFRTNKIAKRLFE